MNANILQNQTNYTTGKSRLSYVNLFTPYKRPDAGLEAKAKYSVTILMPKSDTAAKMRLDAAINAAVQQGISTRWNNTKPPILKIPVHDGDGVRPSDGMPFGEECKGFWVFTAASEQQPIVVDAFGNKILDQTEIYSGIWGHAAVNFYPYNNSGNKGIGCGLNHVLKISDDTPLSGRISAEAAFAGILQQGYAQPQNQAYTQQQYSPQSQGQMQKFEHSSTQIDPITGLPSCATLPF